MKESDSLEAGQRWIKPLPKRVVNKIAAGEVIERPAAVVKELVENAIDAGADRIDVSVERSGVKLIRVVDNGCGIPEEQIEVAFARHATSKIASFDDLEVLGTYGFRGEALPSIASVSRTRMTSRGRGEEVATEIIYEGGVLHSKQPVAAPMGTTVEVEDLFYNTPARRKFLKTEATEARHVSRIATALAMGRHEISFAFVMNSRDIFTASGGSGLRGRIAGLLGIGKTFVAVSGEVGPVRVEGYIGLPDAVVNNRYGQYLFINDRFIFSPSLSHAVGAGYGELIGRGTYPIGGLMISVDPAEVDVNVHPSKTEVRLSREKEVHDAIMRIVRESLRQDGIIPTLKSSPDKHHFTGGASLGEREVGEQSGGNVIPGVGGRPDAGLELLSELCQSPTPADSKLPPRELETLVVDKQTGEVVESDAGTVGLRPVSDEVGPSSGFRLIGRFSDLYLVVQAGDDLYIVDQHTAHERVLYEETLRQIETESVNGQNLLFPVQVELSPEQLAVFEESLELFNQSGFAVSHFGGRMIKIEAVPSVFGGRSPEKMVVKVLDDIACSRKTGSDVTKAIAQSIACRSAVMAGDRLTDREATHLLARLLQCEGRYSCPHGRPTFIRISRADVDRKFGRG